MMKTVTLPDSDMLDSMIRLLDIIEGDPSFDDQQHSTIEVKYLL